MTICALLLSLIDSNIKVFFGDDELAVLRISFL